MATLAIQASRRIQVSPSGTNRRVYCGFRLSGAKLVIELDGGQHQTAVAHDAHRDARMGIAGYWVLRFWNNQVFEETASVLEVILNELLALRPHPVLPPQAGEGIE